MLYIILIAFMNGTKINSFIILVIKATSAIKVQINRYNLQIHTDVGHLGNETCQKLCLDAGNYVYDLTLINRS